VILDRCGNCHGDWMDYGELDQVVRKISRGPLGEWIDTLTAKI
jgi:Zn-finger nucleic acid-binding protein